jgi:hypothetical protein
MKKIENGTEWIDACVERKGANLKGVTEGLRQLVRKTVAGAKETVNPWKIPTFESNGPMCYFSIASNHLTFGFLRGTYLPDPQLLLEGTKESPPREIAYARRLAATGVEKTHPGRYPLEQERTLGRHEAQKES